MILKEALAEMLTSYAARRGLHLPELPRPTTAPPQTLTAAPLPSLR
jgi:hypothetical protein